MRVALISIVLAANAPAQQEPETDSILLATTIIDRKSGETVRRLPIRGYVRQATQLGPGVYQVSTETVDLRYGTRLRIADKTVVLCDLDNKQIWQREVPNIDASIRRHVTTKMILLPRYGSGWVALDRKTGKTAWQAEGIPTGNSIIHDGLLVTTGVINENETTKHVVDARALRNGARAFRVELASAAQLLAVGPRGVAVAGKDWTRFFDRFGPELFQWKYGVDALNAAPDGWVIRRGNEVQYVDHRGKSRWAIPDATDGFMRTRRIYVTGRGDVFITDHQRMSDTGAKCRLLNAKDGKVRWNAEIHGLGVSHSKYWHDIHATVHGDRVTIRSQASGGSFFEVLDLKTGRRTVRGRPK